MLESAADNASILMIDFGLWIGLHVSARLLSPSRMLDRIIFGMTAGSLLVIYIFWRWHDTLPRLSMSAESLWPHLFFTLEFIAVVYTLMSIVILFRSKPFLVLMLIAPMMYWFAGVPAFEADYLAFLRYGAPAILGQTIYMAWISRSRTLPLFMEATHAIVSFAVSATLISAIVKPFGRPFKITDKGGDRSAPKLRWKLALTFGLIAFGSAASIAWAFLSPYSASEISSLDYFNLLWAGISMLIAFIAFVACFELPRGDKFFPVNEAGALALAGDDHAVPCRVAALSTSVVELTWTTAMPPPNKGAQPWLYMERLGWVAVTVAAATGKTALGHLHPTFEQRRRLVIWLFGLPPSDVAETVRITGVIAGLVRRGFRGR
jgi:cellulose synthase (UDP-forming)